ARSHPMALEVGVGRSWIGTSIARAASRAAPPGCSGGGWYAPPRSTSEGSPLAAGAGSTGGVPEADADTVGETVACAVAGGVGAVVGASSGVAPLPQPRRARATTVAHLRSLPG